MIDNGRGCNTHSKRCSIRCFRELKYNREDAAAIVELLILREDDADLLVPEKKDFSLDVRVRRVNRNHLPYWPVGHRRYSCVFRKCQKTKKSRITIKVTLPPMCILVSTG